MTWTQLLETFANSYIPNTRPIIPILIYVGSILALPWICLLVFWQNAKFDEKNPPEFIVKFGWSGLSVKIGAIDRVSSHPLYC